MATTQTENMKESGVEWIGNIPSHWEVKKVAWSFRTMGSGTTPTSSVDAYFDGDIPWVNTGDLNDRFVTEATKTVSASALQDFSALRYYPEGTLLIALYGATIGKLGILTRPSTVNQACFAMGDANSVDSKFAFYWFLGNRRHIIAMAYGGGQPNISGEIIKQLRLTLPPLSEQRAIAEFLDRKTAQIDAVVARKQRLIERLQEKRQALISHAVTKGLDPHAPMKDSGIEWLGQIPAHWTIERLKFRSPHVTVGIVVTPAKYYVDEGVPCLRSLNVRPFQLRDSDLVYMSEESNRLHAKSIITKGDLVAVRTGQPGTTAVVDERFDGANCIDLILIRQSPSFSSKFLSYFMNSATAHVQYGNGSGGAIQQHFNIETASNLVVTWPPLEEQRSIVARLSQECERLNRLEGANRQQITKLQEYRQTLISAAVTGKIDVTKEAEC